MTQRRGSRNWFLERIFGKEQAAAKLPQIFMDPIWLVIQEKLG